MATIIDPPNSIWPNGLKVDSEGYVTFYPLGTNKVDISTITWPDGDKLISPFVYKNDKLVGFVDTKALTVSGSAATTMNYSHIEADFSSIVEGTLTVDAPNAVVKKFIWSVVDNSDNNIIVTIKYKGCKTVDDVKAVDADYKTTDIVNGVWSEGLGDLTDGSYMFDGCNALTSFSSDLSSLRYGKGMFYDCTSLTSFFADLSSLINGDDMFAGCKLDALSVKNIFNTLTYSFGSELGLGMGCNATAEDRDLFGQEAGYADMESFMSIAFDKGWHVFIQYNGRPTTTYSLRRPSENALPVFVKLEETEEHADYTSEDSSKKYRLSWFHETTGSREGYTQFASLEEAIETLNIKPIERN